MQLKYLFFLAFIFLVKPLNAHTFTGMIGFYDGLSHPVLGMDHFLAMLSVGIISSQIGGKAIWSIPSLFVTIMIVGGVVGIFLEINTITFSHIIEWGIIFSVIFLGLSITIDKKLSTKTIMLFVSLFGLFHGLAHGIEMPWAANPLLFALGFSTGTAVLHLFGVGIGMQFIKNKFSNIILKLAGLGFASYGFYLIF